MQATGNTQGSVYAEVIAVSAGARAQSQNNAFNANRSNGSQQTDLSSMFKQAMASFMSGMSGAGGSQSSRGNGFTGGARQSSDARGNQASCPGGTVGSIGRNAGNGGLSQVGWNASGCGSGSNGWNTGGSTNGSNGRNTGGNSFNMGYFNAQWSGNSGSISQGFINSNNGTAGVNGRGSGGSHATNGGGSGSQGTNGRDCGSRDTNGRDCGSSSASQWNVSQNGNTATIDLGKYSLSLNKANSEMTLTNTASGDATRIWGDPHIDWHSNGGNQTDADFNGPLTFRLPDNTKVTVGTVPGSGSVTYADKVTITRGNDAIHVNNLSQTNSQPLTVNKSHDGRQADAAAPDGVTLVERRGVGWVDSQTGKTPTTEDFKNVA